VSHTAAPSASEQVAFPTFQYAVHPVDRIPNWGAMRTPAEWNRSYAEMMPGDFVPVPTYDLAVLTEPIAHLAAPPITADRYAAITAKLYYSTRHFGRYDIDAGEFTGSHSGIDFKLAPGTPIGAIGGGRVHRIGSDSSLGSFVMIEHHVQEEGTVFSIYGHLDEVTVREGQDVAPGTIIGTVGMTGNTSGPHLHLQIDRDTGARPHERFTESTVLSVAEAGRNTVHPMHFIERLLGRKVTLTR
jgi:murein DD-endopeptidase MepM/ murein hydrolase activator NlpD